MADAVERGATTVLRTGKEIAHGNLVAATAACAIVWAGWPLVARLYVHQYDTGAMAKAFERDLDEEELAARVLGIAVLAAASALYAFIVYTSTIVLRLTWLAIKVGWKSLTGVGFLTAQLECGIEARALFAELTASEARLASVLNGLAVAISGALAVKVARDGGLQDLRQATISQGPLLIWGTASHLERNLTARMMQGKSPLFSRWDRGSPRSTAPCATAPT